MFEKHLKSVGVDIPLSDFLEILNQNTTPYTIIKNVKSLLIPAGIGGGYGELYREMRDFGTLLLVKYSHHIPNNSNYSWGSSKTGINDIIWSGGSSTSQYLLSLEEMTKIIEKYPNLAEATRLRLENPEKLEYVFEYTVGCSTDDYFRCINEFRELSKEKYKQLSRETTRVFYVDDFRIEYISNIEENIDGMTISPDYSFYFYDKDGNYYDSWGNHTVIYG